MNETHPLEAGPQLAPSSASLEPQNDPLDADWLKSVALAAGADDVGFVEIARPELAGQTPAALAHLPGARTLMSIVCRVQRQNARSPLRSLFNLEQRLQCDLLEQSARAVTSALEARGVRAVYLPAAFPAEFDASVRLSHKTVAVAAGLGVMGLSRLLLHPVHGSCVTLTTVILDRPVTAVGAPLAENPCLDCKLCAAVCPTGAIRADGHFNGLVCATHNYRFRLGGFQDWVETLVDSRGAADYRARVSDVETLKLWQGLTYETSNQCGYCVGVCPAGERAMGEYRADRKRFIATVIKPLREKAETIYAVAGSDADGYAERHFPHKMTRLVRSGRRFTSARQMFAMLPIAFQRDRSTGLNAVYHFQLTGRESMDATVTIKEKSISVVPKLEGAADVTIQADSDAWLRIANGTLHSWWARLTGRISIHGKRGLLQAFSRCFAA